MSVRTAAASAGLATLLLLTACGGGGDGANADGGASTLRIGIDNDQGCLDPAALDHRVLLQWSRQIGDSLLFWDQEGKPQPWLAESYSVNKKGTEYTFELRDDVTFTDGTALNAQVVKQNFDKLKALGADAFAAQTYLEGYKNSEVVDKYTVKVRFSAPNIPFLYGVGTPQLAIFSGPTTKLDAEARCALGGLKGSGPFKITNYVSMEKVELEKNPDYQWGSAAWKNQGPANVDNLVFNVSQNPSTRAAAAASGDLDVVHKVAESDATLLKDAGFQNSPDPEPATSASWIINNGHGIVGTDPAVREALKIGIDREAIVATKPNIFAPATGVLNTSHPYHVDQSDELAYDPVRAKDVLEEAGWALRDDGFRYKDGQRLDIEVITYTVGADTNMEVAQAQLKEIGINLKVTPLDANAQHARWQALDYDMIVTWNTSGEAAVLKSITQWTNAPEEIERRNAKQLAITDPEERQRYVADFQDYILKNNYLIPLWQENVTPFWSSKVTSMTFDIAGIAAYSDVRVGE